MLGGSSEKRNSCGRVLSIVRYNCEWKVNVLSIFDLLHPAPGIRKMSWKYSESEESISASKCNEWTFEVCKYDLLKVAQEFC